MDPEAYMARLLPRDGVQAEMEAEGRRRRFPIIGPLVGNLVAHYAQAMGARTVFEMGSGFGYSTLHFARAVGPGGRVVHTDTDRGQSAQAEAWLRRAGVADRVEFRVGDARALLQSDPRQYDVVFIDVEKEQYPEAWAAACRRVPPGGLVIADNTLWHGKVAAGARDRQTRGVRTYNRMAFGDPEFSSVLIPLRDGVTVSLRRPTA